ncbi:DUF4956 domain-containing protein [Desulfosporosinus meridiei]|uniref:DUF4956 domain-containing protein n=1 Tax=Desulfosporosinus meridiei (strain ATCC BAA-275 / DSM 13257 / KCTC 12902 / NCIMB 13706 / S10) TaxID=768704 RepID=J7IU63_DESMD|nr:DUF4956 domain-containing protein [Desulfosporosinus meridiei]AFQ42226.1 hypothetical protein Desmer_0158 [Desulfosporosinus meridiei DSM 13257]
MFETLLSSSAGDSLTLTNSLAVLCSALLLGLFTSLVYIHTHKKQGYSAGFTVTMIMLPAIISIIILLIGNNVARAFSLAGAFSLIRFRSAPGEPKDIAYVLFTLAIGLACGMGYIVYAAMFAFILCLVMVILYYTDFANPKANAMQLKIVVPENLNFQGLFDDILNQYTDSWVMNRVKTKDFGTLFEVVYNINLKQAINQKSFLDELRCRNGNLNIALTCHQLDDKIYA